MVRELVGVMKNGKAAVPSGLVSEIAEEAGGAGIDMITALVNQILGVIPAEWELSIISCSKVKRDALERKNFGWKWLKNFAKSKKEWDFRNGATLSSIRSK